MIEKSIEQRIDRLQAGGIIDLHFDLPMDLYEKRERKKVLETEFLPELKAGNIGVVGVAIYIADRYLPDAGLRVALDQIARLYAEAIPLGARFVRVIATSRTHSKKTKSRCLLRWREQSRSEKT